MEDRVHGGDDSEVLYRLGTCGYAIVPLPEHLVVLRKAICSIASNFFQLDLVSKKKCTGTISDVGYMISPNLKERFEVSCEIEVIDAG
jgi:hypothetical protein